MRNKFRVLLFGLALGSLLWQVSGNHLMSQKWGHAHRFLWSGSIQVSKLHDCHHNPVLVHFHPESDLLCLLPVDSLSFPSLRQLLIYLWSLEIYLYIYYKWNHTILVFCDWLLSLNGFNVHPCCSFYQKFVPFSTWLIIVWLYHILFIHSSLDCFYFLAIMTDAPYGHSMCEFLSKYLFSVLLSMYLGLELLGHMVTLCLIF